MAIRGGVLSALVVSTSFFVSGCGGSQQGANSADDAEGKGGVGRASEPAAPRILKPAEEPSCVVAKMRVKNMAAIADSVADAASIPFDWRKILKKDKTAAPFLDVIDWEGSIEGVAAMNLENPKRPHAAFSVGVTGVGPVLDLLDRKNIAAVEGPGDVFYFEIEREDCAVGPAIKGSPARVVCGDRRESLDRLLPYSLRGLPREELSSSDLHVQLEFGPIRDTYGKEMKTALRWAPAAARTQHQKNATFDAALSDGAQALAREGTALIDELERVTFKMSQSSGDFNGEFQLVLKGDQSDTVKILKDLQRRQESVPAAFDGLPSGASAAGYSREVSGELAGPWMSIIADLVQGGLEMEGASQQLASRVGKLINRVGPKGKVGVFARGPLVETKDSQGNAQLGPAWVLSGTTRKKASVLKIMDDGVWLLGSKEWKKLSDEIEELPSLKRKHIAIPGAPGAAVYEWKLSEELLSALSVAGARASGELDRRELAQSMARMMKGLAAVWEYEGTTWISWGQDKSELAKSFAALKNKKSQKMGALGSLHGIREPSVSAGFSTLQGIVGMASFLFPHEVVEEWPGLRKALPNGGETPLVYRFEVLGKETTTASWRIRVPAKFTQDLAALGVMAIARDKKSMEKPSN